jgi:hypothetical protein
VVDLHQVLTVEPKEPPLEGEHLGVLPIIELAPHLTEDSLDVFPELVSAHTFAPVLYSIGRGMIFNL